MLPSKYSGPLLAAIVIEMVKTASRGDEELLLPKQCVHILRRIFEESDYRAVALDSWNHMFFSNSETANMMEQYLAEIQREMRRQESDE